MNAIVIDASITGNILLEDEWTDRTVAIQDALRTSNLIVPPHWRIEVLSLLLTAERRRRMARQDRNRLVAALETIVVSVETSAPDLILALADMHRLTAYDAVYLELAQRGNRRLATNDVALSDAGKVLGIEIITAVP